MNNNRIEALDSLRGIAAMIVVIFHCLLSYTIFYHANYNYEFNNWLMEIFTVTPLHTLWAGKEAVLLFFVLSGFVLMIPYTDNRRPKYIPYIIKRFCRIYIPYVIVMVISVILTMFFWEYNNLSGLSSTYENRWNHEVSLKSLIAYIAMIDFDTANVNGVVWTLFIELKVSIYLPIFLLLISLLEWKRGLIAALLLNVLLLISFTYGLHNTSFSPLRGIFLFFYNTFYYNFFFILGAILAKQRHSLSNFKTMIPFKKILLLILSLILINSRWVHYFTDFSVESIEDGLSAIGFSLLFFVVLISKRVDNFLNNDWLLYLGRISFSLYLIHIPVLMLTTVFLGKLIPVWLAFCLVPILCIPVAHITYLWIEKPAIALGKKISKYKFKINNSKRNTNNNTKTT